MADQIMTDDVETFELKRNADELLGVHIQDFSSLTLSQDSNTPLHWVTSLQRTVLAFFKEHHGVIKPVLGATCLLAYAIYFVCALVYDWENSIALIVITSLVVLYIIYAYTRDNYGDKIDAVVLSPCNDWIDTQWHYLKWFIYCTLILGILHYLTFFVIQEVKQVQSLVGLAFCILLPIVTCKHPDQIKWRPVIWGFGLQFLLGVLVLRWRTGYLAVKWFSQELNTFIFYSLNGASATFGDPWFFLHPFLMLVVPLVVWIGVVMAVCFHLGLIQSFARKLGWLMKITLQTTAIESVSLAVNIFLSVLDTMIMLKKFLPKLTKSEFHCFLVGAHSTIAGFAFGLIVIFGISPQHLLTGAVMSAPAAVAIAKLNFPETEKSQLENDEDFDLGVGTDHNVFLAASKGLWAAGKGATEILIQTMTFVALIIFVDEVVMWLGMRIGWEISLSIFLSYLFLPLSYLIGIDSEDVSEVSSILGIKVLANEFLGFIELGKAQLEGTISVRSGAIATYAMCGFSSFGTFTIFLGVWNSVDPSRTKEYAQAIPRLMMNSNLACFSTACIANILYSEDVVQEEGKAFNLITFLGLFPRYEEILDFIGFPLY